MAENPFGFLRGAAAVMARDLSTTPTIGLPVVICGDAHVDNFGFYGTPQRDVVLDINDFDETTIGPWEWDLKRLTASVNVLGRENGLDAKERRAAVMTCSCGYRVQMQRLQAMGVLDLWYLHTVADRFDVAAIERAYPRAAKLWPKAQAVFAKAAAKARKTDDALLLRRSADRGVDGGTRAYLALLFGNSDADPLFLQVKEALAPSHEAYVVRQMRNLKGALPMDVLSGDPFEFFAFGFGALLARAHARSGDAAVIAGYCGDEPVLDEALADWAEAYGDQTVKDHAPLQKAIKSERITAVEDA